MGSNVSKKSRQPGREDLNVLTSQTPFSVNEVEALYELYKKLSKSVINDGFIQKAELQLALFKNSKRQNLFADRIFDLFDVNKNGHIEFGEFVQSLSVFHPKTPEEEKIKCAFRLYDLRHTGSIEHEELKEMVLALLSESDLSLSDDIVETIVDKVWSGPWLCSWMAAREHSFSSYMSLCLLDIDFHTRWYVKTFREVDLNGDGRIDQEEWKEYVARNPSLLRNMTLPYLMDITLAFPSFVLNTETEDSELGA